MVGEGFQTTIERWSKAHLGGHDMVRNVDQHGEALIHCRKVFRVTRGTVQGRKLVNR